jgi:acetyl-CoA C-acetyltransferase
MSTEIPLILAAARTPIGTFQGALVDIPAPKLGGIAIAEAVRRSGLPLQAVDEVFMGNVLMAGLGQAPARQAAIGAGLPPAVGATTINKVCGSSLKAVMLAAQAIRCRDAHIVVAGGMESMSRAPYLCETARNGSRLGHVQMVDSLIKDGLWDAYNDWHMGHAGELCAKRFGLTRLELDDFALESYARAREAVARGTFRDEIVPVPRKSTKGASPCSEDEEPNRAPLEKLRVLKPAFDPDGVLTAGNSSKCNDGAAALVLASGEEATKRGVRPIARLVGYAEAGVQPEYFPVAPIHAIQKLLKLTGVTISDIDLFEINEAFSSVSLCIMRELNLDPARCNVHGGAVALGHPIGATGARMLTTLLYSLRARSGHLGLVSACIGGGEAIALLVERVVTTGS